nr:hypothetical protein Iba_chr02eCG8890 [Ipomoea batatas]
MDGRQVESRAFKILGTTVNGSDGQVALAYAEEASDLHRSDSGPSSTEMMGVGPVVVNRVAKQMLDEGKVDEFHQEEDRKGEIQLDFILLSSLWSARNNLGEDALFTVREKKGNDSMDFHLERVRVDIQDSLTPSLLKGNHSKNDGKLEVKPKSRNTVWQ